MTKTKLNEIINQLPENVFNKYALKLEQEIKKPALINKIKLAVKEKGYSNIVRSGVPKNTLTMILSDTKNIGVKVKTLNKVLDIIK